MRHNLRKMVVALMLLWPGIAAAAVLDGATGTADCNGWTADVQITYRPDVFMVHLEKEVVLTDAGGAEVERFYEAGYMTPAAGQTVTYSFAGPWTAALDGQYTAAASFVLTDIVADGANVSQASFTVEFGCGEVEDTGEPVCIRTRGWWARHPDQWPVSSLVLGASEYDKTDLVRLMGGRMGGDVTRLMARQLVATKLNLAGGTDPSITNVVSYADAYLVKHGLDGRPARRDRLAGIKLALGLLWYNLQGCPEMPAEKAYDEDKAALEALEGETFEAQTFGAVKSLFR